MLRILKRTDKGPVERGTYGVVTGKFVGEMLTYIRKTGGNYEFLSIPKMIIREIPDDKFEFAMANNIMELVEQLPRDVYLVVEAQFNQVLKNGKDTSN